MIEHLVIFLVCTFSGILTGLLGIGGGMIIVPAFLIIMPFFGVEFSLHQIIAISSTCVFANCSATAFYRRKEKFLDKKLLTKMCLAIMLGTVGGAYLSSFAPDKALVAIYCGVSLISLYLIKGEIYFDLNKPFLKILLYLIFIFIGAISSAIGIGGAVLFATALKCFMGKNVKELLPSMTILLLAHAGFAFFSKFALGEVTLMIIPIAIVSSLIGTKIGVKISQKLSANTITNMMCGFLIFALLRVFMEFFK